MTYEFEVCELNKTYRKEFEITTLCGLGFTSRYRENIQAHIDEQLKLGIQTSTEIPHYFLIWPGLLDFSYDIFVVGHDTTGEIEFTIMKDEENEIYIGLISDHCDRKISALRVTKSKQASCKPVCKQIWRYRDIKNHWDKIQLESFQYVNGECRPYQKGSLADYIPLEEIITFSEKSMKQKEHYLVMSGTVATIDGYFENQGFLGRMIDPVLNRMLTVDYRLSIFPDLF